MVKQIVTDGKKVLDRSVNLKVIAKALIVSYAITIPLFAVFSLILTYTRCPEKYIAPACVMTTIVSILVAGSSVTRSARSKGWLYGGFVGLLYMLVLYIISSLAFDNYHINRYVVTMTVIGVLTGAIGGILGINMKPPSYSKKKYK